MTNEERTRKIEVYGSANDLLTAALTEFPPGMWQYRSAPDNWTIHEIVIHIADSEANSYVRCRRFIAEPGSMVLGYDERGWADRLRYHEHSTADALQLFKWLRLESYHLIKTLSPVVWSNTVNHMESGVMTMDQWLDIYARHIPDHIAQMRAVYAAWKNSRAR